MPLSDSSEMYMRAVRPKPSPAVLWQNFAKTEDLQPSCSEHRITGNHSSEAGVFSWSQAICWVQVKVHPIQSVSALLAALASLCLAQGNPRPENATAVVLK